MIQVLRIWPEQGVSLWYTVDEPVQSLGVHINATVAQWDEKLLWDQLSDVTWRNRITGARIELLMV